MRLVKRGPWVPALIMHDELVGWCAIINGVLQGPPADDPVHAEGVFRIWTSGRRCTEAEYRYRLDFAQWASKHDASSPAANPSQPINLNALPPIF